MEWIAVEWIIVECVLAEWSVWIAVKCIAVRNILQLSGLELSVCWQERGGGTASGLSCCQLNTALIDDHADHHPPDHDTGDTGGGGD